MHPVGVSPLSPLPPSTSTPPHGSLPPSTVPTAVPSLQLARPPGSSCGMWTLPYTPQGRPSPTIEDLRFFPRSSQSSTTWVSCYCSFTMTAQAVDVASSTNCSHSLGTLNDNLTWAIIASSAHQLM